MKWDKTEEKQKMRAVYMWWVGWGSTRSSMLIHENGHFHFAKKKKKRVCL